MIIRNMTADDVLAIASIARPADAAEIEASCGMTVSQSLEYGLKESLRALVIESDQGEILCACGDVMRGIGVGVVWMITTKHITKHRRGFLEASKLVVADALRRHYQLINYVDARNKSAVRWLKWLGFDVGDPEPFGRAGLPFHPFTLMSGSN